MSAQWGLRFFYTAHPGWQQGHVRYACGYIRRGDDLEVAFARCSPNDTYDKRRARLICAGRLTAGKSTVLKNVAPGKVYEALLAAIETHEREVQNGYRKQRA